MSRRLSLPENTPLFGGSGKCSSISKVSVTLPPATLRTAQILGGSEVHTLPISPRGLRHHPKWGSGPRGTEQVQGRGGVRGPTQRLLIQELGPNGVPMSKATEFLQPRRRLFRHLGLDTWRGDVPIWCVTQ